MGDIMKVEKMQCGESAILNTYIRYCWTTIEWNLSEGDFNYFARFSLWCSLFSSSPITLDIKFFNNKDQENSYNEENNRYIV